MDGYSTLSNRGNVIRGGLIRGNDGFNFLFWC